MGILTEQEMIALRGTLGLSGFDVYRQAIILGKFRELNFLLHGVLAHIQIADGDPRGRMVSNITSAMSLGNVWELSTLPDHLAFLNEVASQALTINIAELESA